MRPLLAGGAIVGTAVAIGAGSLMWIVILAFVWVMILL